MLDLSSRISISLATFDSFAFVVALLAFSEGNDDFDIASCSQKFGWDDTHARFFGSFEVIDLFATGEELANTGVD